MWTGRIFLLVLLLLTAGGWFDAHLSKLKKAAILIAAPPLLALTFVPTLVTSSVRLSFAPCAFALLVAAFCPTEHPFGAVSAAVLGGVIGWKLCDALPLFFEQGFLIAAPTLLLAALYCRDTNAKALAVAASPFFMLLLRAIGDFTLFQSAVLELGNEDVLAAQSAGLLCLLTGRLAVNLLQTVRNRLQMSV